MGTIPVDARVRFRAIGGAIKRQNSSPAGELGPGGATDLSSALHRWGKLAKRSTDSGVMSAIGILQQPGSIAWTRANIERNRNCACSLIESSCDMRRVVRLDRECGSVLS
jgi:hypothetical protein